MIAIQTESARQSRQRERGAAVEPALVERWPGDPVAAGRGPQSPQHSANMSQALLAQGQSPTNAFREKVSQMDALKAQRRMPPEWNRSGSLPRMSDGRESQDSVNESETEQQEGRGVTAREIFANIGRKRSSLDTGAIGPKRALLYPDVPWGDGPFPSCEMSSRILQVMDWALLLSCLYVGGTVPYIVGFGYADVTHEQCIFSTMEQPESAFMGTLDIVTDTIFFADIFVQFHCAVWELIPGTAQHWELYDDLKTVRWLYFTGEFKWDCLGQIPWQYLDCVWTSSPPGLKALRLLRLIKMLRLHRLNRRIAMLEQKHGSTFKVMIALAKLLVTLFLTAHWMGCLWFYVGFPNGWVVDQGLVDGSGNLVVGVYFAWITSFYWSITTMTTIGYGDISAGTAEERTMACFAMCLGCGLFAWATGQITNTLTSSSQCKSRFVQSLEEMEEFMQCRGISSELRNQVKCYYQLKFPSERIFDELAIMRSLPRELRMRLMLELFADMMRLVPVFVSCNAQTQREICNRMRSYNCTEGNDITKEGEIATHLYVVRLGSVRVTRKDEELAILARGEMFGENAVFSWSCDGKRTRSVTALTMCDLCVLSAEDVDDLLIQYNSFYFGVRRIIDAHSARLRNVIANGQPVSTADLYMIDWKGCAEKIIEENKRLLAVSNKDQEVAKEFCESENLGDGTAPFRSPGLAHHVLQTRFRIVALSLDTSLRPGDFPNGQAVSVELSCKGIPGVPTSGVCVESQAAELCVKDDGHVNLNVTIDVSVFHESNRWDELGDMQFLILDKGIDLSFAKQGLECLDGSMRETGVFCPAGFLLCTREVSAQHMQSLKNSALRRKKETKAAAEFSTAFGAVGRKSEPGSGAKSPNQEKQSSPVPKSGGNNRAILWSGTIPVAELVRSRVIDTTVRKVHPKIEVDMQPHDDKGDKGVAVMQVVARLKRILRSGSIWRRIFTDIRNMPLSKYFRGRQRKASQVLHASFHQKMDAMLLSRSVFKSLARGFGEDRVASPLNELQAGHSPHVHHDAHSSAHHHDAHTHVRVAAKSPLVDGGIHMSFNDKNTDVKHAAAKSHLVERGFHMSFSEKGVAAPQLNDNASSTSSSTDAWKVDVETQLQNLKTILEEVVEQQRKHRHDVCVLRSELQPMLEWSGANSSLGSEVAALRSDMREMARSQGAIMAALQEHSKQQQEIRDATHTLMARETATQAQLEARAHADSQSLQQQRNPSLNAIEMSPPPEARRMVADLSRVHKAVQRAGVRSHEGNGDSGVLDDQSAVGSDTIDTAKGEQHSNGASRGAREVQSAGRWGHRRDGASERQTPRGTAGPTVSDRPTHSQLEEAGAQDAEEQDNVDFTGTPADTPRSRSDLGGKGGWTGNSTPSTSYSKRSSVPLSPRTVTTGRNVSTRTPPVPRLPLTGSAWQQANAHAPSDSGGNSKGAAQERLPLYMELQRSRDGARDRSERVGASGQHSTSTRVAAHSSIAAGARPNLQNLQENIDVVMQRARTSASSVASPIAGQHRVRRLAERSGRASFAHDEETSPPMRRSPAPIEIPSSSSVAETRGIWERVSNGVQALLSPRSQEAFEKGELRDVRLHSRGDNSPTSVQRRRSHRHAVAAGGEKPDLSDDDDESGSLYGDI